jgi:WD40 repeat protein
VPIGLTCQCGKQLRVRDDLAGKRVRCPGCRELLVVEAEPLSPPTPVLRPTNVTPAEKSGKSKARPPQDEEEDHATGVGEGPPKRKRKAAEPSRKVLWWSLAGAGALAAVLAVVLIVVLGGKRPSPEPVVQKGGPPPPKDLPDPPGPGPGQPKESALPAPALLKSFEYRPNQVNCIALTADGKILAAGCEDGTVKLWGLAAGKELASFKADSNRVGAIAFNAEGTLLASGGGDKVVRLWEVPAGKEKAVLDDTKNSVFGGDAIKAITFLPDGKGLVEADYTGRVRVWDLGGPAVRSAFGTAPSLEAVALAPGGGFLAAGGTSQVGDKAAPRVKLYELPAGKPRGPALEHVANVYALAFTPDGKLLAAGGDKLGEDPPAVTVWDVATGQKHATLKGPEAPVKTLAFSPDGKLLASGGWDHTTRLWDVGTGREVAQIKHKAFVHGVAFLPGGKTLVTGSWEQTSVQLWDLTPVLKAAAK